MSKVFKSHVNIHKLETVVPPTILTIFGATGDLSTGYLIPALLHLDETGLLPDNFRLVCVARKDLDSKSFLDFIVKKSGRIKISQAQKKHFLEHLTYFKADFEDTKSFAGLSEILADHELPSKSQGKAGNSKNDICYNRLYYFATSPQLFSFIARALKFSRLLTACQNHNRTIRVLVEKPFGFNLKSAQALNKLLLKYFTEEQIYRIDHFLGKETVQNLMIVRFANSLFESLWNKDHIDHVEISVLEKDGARARAAYYDQTGALKDMVQNHILQMLALITMDEPESLTAESIHKQKIKILKALMPFKEPVARVDLVKGQYETYLKEVSAQESRTETFVALKAFLNLPRWKGVPFYLRTGKLLNNKIAQISIHFKEPVRCLFQGCGANVLTFRIQPDESVFLQINNKIPGFGLQLHQGRLNFSYEQTFSGEIPTAYERLLLDFLQGDQRLFISSSEIEAAWAFVDSVAAAWKNLPLHIYKNGSLGPEEVEKWIQKDYREWWTR